MSDEAIGADTAARATAMRSMLLEAADGDAVAKLASDIVNGVNDRINDANISAASSLLARALIARAIAAVAAEWWRDMSHQPLPVTAAAIASIMRDPPPQFDGETFEVDG